MSKDSLEIQKLLDDKIPRDVISQREGSGGRSLSYLEGWYVIDRLNKILGQGNWQYETNDPVKVYETTVTNKRGQQGRGVSYTAIVTLTAQIGEQTVSFTDVGAGKGIDYSTGLEADESAVKEAVTDGLKRCAKNLGMSMGLALYDKSQENVDDGEEEQSNRVASQSSPREATRTRSPEKNIQPEKAVETNAGEAEAEKTREVIRAAIRVGTKKRPDFKDVIRDYLKSTFNVEKLDTLTLEQLKTVLTHVKGIL